MTIETLDINTLASVVANINGLYSNLVSYTVGLILVIGALLPLIISYFQHRQFKLEQEAIKNQITLEVKQLTDGTQQTLEQNLKAWLTQEAKTLNLETEKQLKQLEKDLNIAQGSVYHVQANSLLDSPVLSLNNCLNAIKLYMKANDERNIRSVLTIIEGNINALSKDDFEEHDDLKNHIDEIFDLLKNNNQNGRFTLDLHSLKVDCKAAQKRETNQ